MRVLPLLSVLLTSSLVVTAVPGLAQEQSTEAVPVNADTINSADLMSRFAGDQRPYIVVPAPLNATKEESEATNKSADSEPAPVSRDPALVRLQILLDQNGASPGVIDGYDGDNMRKAVMGLQALAGLPVTGTIDADLLGRIETGAPVIEPYVIAEADVENVTGETPEDYADKAQLDFLGYETAEEALAERFHMDVNLLVALNPDAAFAPGETIAVASTSPNRTGQVARIEADKALRQVRAYDAQGVLLVTYPATIGSQDTPSPSGSYVVEVVAPMPNYTYNPEINFQQGDNTEVLTIPPGPNGPVGSMWIALSKPTYGIHGTPEPSKIDKTGSYGCIRLTNWDAEELAGMVEPGVTVDFVEPAV